MSHVMCLSVTNVEYVGGWVTGLGLGLGFYQFDSFGGKMYGSERIAKAL